MLYWVNAGKFALSAADSPRRPIGMYLCLAECVEVAGAACFQTLRDATIALGTSFFFIAAVGKNEISCTWNIE